MNVPYDTLPIADILVVDDMPANLQLLAAMLKERGHRVRPVTDGNMAIQAARRLPPDLILLDINMPGMNGYEVCTELKAEPLLKDIPVIFISANTEVFDKVKAFSIGGVDYITKPFYFDEVEARVETHLKIMRLRREVDALNSTLQDRVQSKINEISDSQLATILALAKLADYRDKDTGNHIFRVQRYCYALARRLADEKVFGSIIDEAFVATIFQASALHDIGKVGIPDIILLKPGKLSEQEFEIMKTHTTIGADTLSAVVASYPNNDFVRMGVEVARSHHEYWNGSGYPDGLCGEEISLAARILVIPDQYDALRTKRPYKPAFDAAKTYAILTEGDERSCPDHVDPRMLAAFKEIAPEFDAIYDELGV